MDYRWGGFLICCDFGEQFLTHQSRKAKQELLEDRSYLIPVRLL